tara:strand:- start:2505 stop:3062 length:558 start_codon:yes stop_codon:yes gene_type:complete
MTDELERLKGDVEDAIGKVGAEHSYAKALLQKLQKIEAEGPEDGLKDAKRGFHLVKWIGRGTRKVDRDEVKIIADLERLGERLPKRFKKDEERLLQELKIAEGKIAKAGSRVTGEIREDWKHIMTYEKLMERYDDDAGQRDKVHRLLEETFKEAEAGIQDLVGWLETTTAILREVDTFEDRLEES